MTITFGEVEPNMLLGRACSILAELAPENLWLTNIYNHLLSLWYHQVCQPCLDISVCLSRENEATQASFGPLRNGIRACGT